MKYVVHGIIEVGLCACCAWYSTTNYHVPAIIAILSISNCSRRVRAFASASPTHDTRRFYIATTHNGHSLHQPSNNTTLQHAITLTAFIFFTPSPPLFRPSLSILV